MVQAVSAVLPPPPIPTPRWPGLLLSTGGEAAAATQDERWASGFRFVPPTCGWNAELPLIACAGGTFDVGAANQEALDAVAVDALYHWSAQQRSTFCSTEDEMVAEARNRLKLNISHKLEAELWTGAASRTLSSSGQYLTDGNASILSSGTPIPLVYALAKLQKAWGNCAQGARGMIHCPVDMATLLLSANAIRKEGALLLDVFDNIVVAGTGYDGSGDDHTPDASGDTAYAFMTGMVSVVLGSVSTASTTDPTNNTDLAVAYRPGAAIFDPCCVVGVNVDMCSVSCTPSG